MGKIKVQIKAHFGTIVLEGDNPREVLGLLRNISPDFMEEVSSLISTKLVSSLKTQLKGIVEHTTEGPVITTRQKLTHYESIGIVLSASDGKKNTASQINQLVELSGIKAMVPARLNEMTKRGLVFKPDPSRPEFRLTAQGQRWIEEEVLTRLRGVT